MGNSLEKNTLEKNTLDKNTLDKNTLDKNTLEKNTLRIDLDELFDENGWKKNVDKNKYINLNVKKIILSRTKNTNIKIGNNFLRNCIVLEELDLSEFSNVSHIGKWFLGGCISLIDIDLTKFEFLNINLDDIFDENGWKNGVDKNDYKYLNAIKIKLFRKNNTNIKIGDEFLSCCYNLRQIDLSEISHVVQIGDYFLSCCYNLKKLDTKSLLDVTQIGNHFLSIVPEIQKSIGYIIDNSVVSQKNNPIKPLKNNYVSSESDDEQVEIRRLTNFKSNEQIDFIQVFDYMRLKKIDLDGFVNVKIIGDGFLYCCHELKELDIKELVNLKQIGRGFAAECIKLENINLGCFLNVERIGEGFLSSCKKIKKIDERILSKIVHK